MGSALLDALQADIKACMKNHENDKLVALRTLHSEIKNATVNAGREVADADVAGVIAKAIKQRTDSIAQFRQGGREDLAAKEQMEIDLFRKYQPPQLGRAEIEALVVPAIAATGAAGKKEMGKVMQVLMPQVKGKADGKLVNQIVMELLAKAEAAATPDIPQADK